MPVSIVCPNCDARLTAPDTVLGKKVKCKKCDEPFLAKRASADDEESPRKPAKVRRPADEDAGDEDQPRPKAKKKGAKKKGSPAMLIVLLVVGAVVLIGGGVGVYLGFIKEDKPTEAASNNNPVKGPPGSNKGPPGMPGAAGAWFEHVDADGKYRISFPGRPTTQNQTVMVGGMQHTLKVTQLQAGVEIFVANAVVIPPGQDQDPEVLLNTAEQQAGAQVPNSTVTSKQPISHAGVNGREIVLAIQSPAGPLTGVVRVFVNNGRIYSLGVVGPTVQASSPNVVKFFESLKFE